MVSVLCAGGRVYKSLPFVKYALTVNTLVMNPSSTTIVGDLITTQIQKYYIIVIA